ncbi:MAG TPA: hypothetical protein VGB24_23440 [Longimicrobium sp.]|jgi:hypothetical protein|uniref:hypothetical protein n=1 Tax=Longimicrobium sp. TaxID=2029185 RepID=UPI002ED7FE66
MPIIPLLLALSTAAAAPSTGNLVIAAQAAHTDSAVTRAAEALLSARDRGDWARYVDLLSADAIREVHVELLRIVDPAEGGVPASEMFALHDTETLERLPARDQLVRGLRHIIPPRDEARWVVLAPEAQPDGSVRVRAHQEGGDPSASSVLYFVRVNDTWRAKRADDYVRGALAGVLAGRLLKL